MMVIMIALTFQRIALSPTTSVTEIYMKMKSIMFLVMGTFLVVGAAFASERDITEKTSVPACYERRTDALKSALEITQSAAQAECRVTVDLKDIVVGHDASCDGVSITAIFSCAE
jgi:hypothetical protein